MSRYLHNVKSPCSATVLSCKVEEEEVVVEVAEGVSVCEMCEFKYEFMLLMAEKARLASEVAFDMRKKENAIAFTGMKGRSRMTIACDVSSF